MTKFETIELGNVYYCPWESGITYINCIDDLTHDEASGYVLWSSTGDITEFTCDNNDYTSEILETMVYLCHIDELAGTTIELKFPELFV
jgi:hypothetical protein